MQKTFIEACDEIIDLEAVANGAIKCLEEIQEPLMNYQLDQDIINSCFVLLDAKKKIDENSTDADVWEIWKLILDSSWKSRRVDVITLQGHYEGYDITVPYGRIRLNWTGYTAVATYLVYLWRKTQGGRSVQE